jgi:LysR family glycine cleavage system transcriptional activator
MQPAGTMVLELPPETIVPLCSPALMQGEHPIRTVADLRHHALIHSEGCLVGWRDWMRLHRKTVVDITRGPRFARSFMAISAAADGMGVCLESLLLVHRELETGRLVAPFGVEGLRVNGYTMNLLKSRAELPKLRSFQDWLFAELDK